MARKRDLARTKTLPPPAPTTTQSSLYHPPHLHVMTKYHTFPSTPRTKNGYITIPLFLTRSVASSITETP